MTFATARKLALSAFALAALAGCVQTATPAATPAPVVVQTPAPTTASPSVVVTPRTYP